MKPTMIVPMIPTIPMTASSLGFEREYRVGAPATAEDMLAQRERDSGRRKVLRVRQGQRRATNQE